MALTTLITHGFTTIALLITAALLIPLTPLASRWYQLVIIQSGSMAPALPVGSIAVYHSQTEYKVGDVVAYRVQDGEDRRLVVHRIVERQQHPDNSITYLTKGDANDADTQVAIFANQVQGKVIGTVPQAGFVIHWLQSPWGTLLIIFGFLAVLLIIELMRLP